jgi:ankyrin repeat protein
MATQQQHRPKSNYAHSTGGNKLGQLILCFLILTTCATGIVYRSAQQGKMNRALLDAVANADSANVQSLLRQGANPDMHLVCEIKPTTPLQVIQWVIRSRQIIWHNEPVLVDASISGRVDIVEALLDAGADIDATNQDGWTALIGALGQHRTDVALVLLQRGAAINIRGDNGVTALKIAERNHNAQIVKILKQEF